MAEIILHPALAAHVDRIGHAEPTAYATNPWAARCASAAQTFMHLGLPDLKDESYRYADLPPLFARSYAYSAERIAPEQPPHCIFQCDLPQLEAYTIFMINGSVYADSGASCESLPNGLIYGSARCAMQNHPALLDTIEKERPEQQDALAALASSLAIDGYFIYVPEALQLDKPIQIVSILQGEQDRLVASHSAILMGASAKAEVVICSHTLASSTFMDNALLDCHLQERAQLDLTLMQNAHNSTAQILHLQATIKNHALLKAKTLTIHGGFTRNNIEVHLQEPHAECHLGGMALIDGTQYADTQTNVHHLAPQCQSSQLYKNIVDGSAKSVFYGIINVHPDAQLTTAFQRAASIMLTKQGAVHARPQLLIHADDVKCSHGATVGQLDDNARFYLRSRGIAASDVDRMLMNAFVGDVLRDIHLLPLKERVESIVEKRLRGEQDRCHSGCSTLV